jgi:[ribosomal protein S5]-alanine N-acetyltransferase
VAFAKNGLHFREVETGDLPWLRELRNDPRNVAGWRDPRSVQTMANQDEWYASLSNLNQAFVVEHETDDGPVRTVGLLRFRLDYPMSIAAMTGTDVMPSMTGQGYGRRILRSGADYVIQELGFHRVTAEALESNTAAIHIIQAAGFKHEGTLRNYIYRNNRWNNWLLFSRLREDE